MDGRPAIDHDDGADDMAVDPGMPCFVPDEASFRRAVADGIASAQTAPLVSLDQVEAELHRIIHGQD